MKKLALVFTAVFLIGATVSAKTTNTFEDNSTANAMNGYGNSFIFTEGGIEFSVFPDGQFDFYVQDVGPDVSASINTPNTSFTFNSGYDYNPYVQYDDFGAIIQIENTPIYYDYYGRVTQVGNVNINYNNYGRISRLGGLYVHYDNYRNYSYCSGYINVYNRAYVYRPWHAYYVIPAPSLCIVFAKPYRQYYKPVRYQYYRPYTNNYRQAVHHDYRRVATTNGTRRGAVAANNRISDRYRQEASPSRRNATTTRSNPRVQANNTRQANGNDRAVRSSSQTRTRQTQSGNANTRSSNLQRTRQAQSGNNNDRTLRSGASQKRTAQTDISVRSAQRQRQTRSKSAVTSNRGNVNKNSSVRKPNTSNTRTYSTKQNTRSKASTGSRAAQQKSSRSTSRGGRGTY